MLGIAAAGRAISARLRGDALRTTLALYHLFAGGLGLKTTVLFAPEFVHGLDPRVRPKLVLAYAGIGAVFLAVAMVGVLLERQWQSAIFAGFVIQVLQIPLWSLHGGVYQFFAGFYAGAGFSPLGANVFGGWKASLQLGLGSPSADQFFGVNLVPVIVIRMLDKVRREDLMRLRAAERVEM